MIAEQEVIAAIAVYVIVAVSTEDGVCGVRAAEDLVIAIAGVDGVAALVAAVFIELKKIRRGDHLVLADLHLAERVRNVCRLETRGRIERSNRHLVKLGFAFVRSAVTSMRKTSRLSTQVNCRSSFLFSNVSLLLVQSSKPRSLRSPGPSRTSSVVLPRACTSNMRRRRLVEFLSVASSFNEHAA